MIKHHPSQSLLLAFSRGQLPASLSIAVSAHTDNCSECMHQVLALQESSALFLDEPDTEFEQWHDMSMIDAITSDESEMLATNSQASSVNIKGTEYTLPKSLSSVQLSSWMKLGKLARAKVDLNEGEVHANLLHIESGGTIPQHTHKGFEVTVLLAGEFHDENGSYVPGDFIWLNESNTHSPQTTEGCLCLTVANDALHFTQGLSMALNPIGKLIY